MDRPYALADVALMTGITERTLRKHVASGALAGEKVHGKWRYTLEEVGRFMSRPEVKKLAAQHRRALADDFLNTPIKSASAMLCVLDMPGASESFLENLLAACEGVQMAYSLDAGTNMTRVTLVGAPEAVRGVLEKLK
jgi:hypothetical protein